MNSGKNFFLLLIGVFIVSHGAAQENDWPRSIETPKGTIIMYQPQPESFSGNKISARCAVSYTEKGAEPIFGAVWLDAIIDTNLDDRTAVLESVKVTNVKFPTNEDQARLDKFKTIVETEVPKWDLVLSNLQQKFQITYRPTVTVIFIKGMRMANGSNGKTNNGNRLTVK